MAAPSDPDQEEVRRQVLGLGQASARKSHYPSLRQRLTELERFRFLVDVSSDLLLVVNADTGEILDANASACRRLGRSREELIGIVFASLLETALRPKLAELLANCRAIPPDAASLVSLLPGEGDSTFPAEIAVGCACRLADDNRIAVVAIRDISHRLTGELALRKSEERYRLLVEQSEDGIFVADAGGRYTDVNRAGCEMLGYSRDELLNMSIADIVAPEETARIGPEVARLAAGAVVRSEWRFRRKDGSSFIGEVVGRQLADGRIQGIVRDISERHAVEQRLRETERQHRIALDAAQLGTWSHDIASDVIWFDERARACVGTDRETMPAAEAFARIHPDDGPAFKLERAAGLDPAGSSGQATHEFRVVGPDGTIRWLRVHAHIEFDGDGEGLRPVRAIGTMEDITLRKQAEERLARLSRAYEAVSEINKWVARARSEAELLAAACRVTVDHAGFLLVRVVGVEADVPEAPIHCGPAAAMLERSAAGDSGPAAAERSRIGMALRHAGYHCSSALDRDPLFAPMVQDCGEFGFGSMGMFPLRVEGRIAFAMIFHAGPPDAFDPDMIRLLREVADDISFGLERMAEIGRVRDAEQRFSTLFRFSPSAIVITRLGDGLIVDANDAFLDTFDYSYDEVVGRPAWDAHLWADLEDRATMFRYLNRSGRVKDFEARWLRRSGELRDCIVSAEIVTLGRELHMVSMVTDVTARREIDRLLYAREQEFRALVEHSPDIISRFDKDCRRLYVNPAMTRGFIGSPEAILGKTPTESAPDSGSAREIQAAVAQVAATGHEWELEVEAQEGPSAHLVHRHVRLVPELGADGQVASVLAIGRDISRVKETERLLRESQSQLRQLGARREAAREDERKRMAREIHDVLGQLLTALRLDIDMLGMEFGGHEPMLLERTAKATELVDGTIAIVRSLASALRPAALNMGIVSALEWQAKEFAERAGVVCEVSMKESEIDLDETQAIGVFRLVQESLTNVARHAQATRVDVALERIGDGYRLVVRDDGIGFDPETARRSALGLVGMRERAMDLGGDLYIHSAPGKGTRIEAGFPARPAGEIP